MRRLWASAVTTFRPMAGVAAVLVAGLLALLLIGRVSVHTLPVARASAFLMFAVPALAFAAALSWRIMELAVPVARSGPTANRVARFLRDPYAVAGLALVSGLLGVCAVAASQIGVVTPGLNADRITMGGVVPQADSKQYFGAAFNMAHNGFMNHLPARRPVHASILSSLFVLSDWSRITVFLLQGALGGMVLGYVAVQLARVLGISFGLAVWALLYWVVRDYFPTFLSEPTGVMLGYPGIALVIGGFVWRRPVLVAVGIGVVLLAFSARSGAYFVLPALSLAALWMFRRERAQALRLVLATVLAGTLSLAIPSMADDLYDTNDGSFQGNFSFLLYQIATGSRDWRQVEEDYTEDLEEVAPAERYDFIYDRAFEIIRDDPASFVWNAVTIGALAFYELPGHLAFVIAAGTGVGAFTEAVSAGGYLPPFVLFLAGFATILLPRGWGGTWRVVVVLVTVGYAASLPFISIGWGLGEVSLRHQSVTFPLVFIAFAGILARPQAIDLLPADGDGPESRGLVLGGALYLLTAIAFFIPVLHSTFVPDTVRSRLSREDDGSQEFFVVFGPMTPFLRIADGPGPVLRPDIPLGTFNALERVKSFDAFFGDFAVGEQLSIGILPQRGAHRMFHGPSFCVPDENTLFRVKVRSKVGTAIYYVDELEPVRDDGTPFAESEVLPFSCLYDDQQIVRF